MQFAVQVAENSECDCVVLMIVGAGQCVSRVAEISRKEDPDLDRPRNAIFDAHPHSLMRISCTLARQWVTSSCRNQACASKAALSALTLANYKRNFTTSKFQPVPKRIISSGLKRLYCTRMSPTAIPGATDEYRLPLDLKPTHYEVTIQTDLEKQTFSGFVKAQCVSFII